MCAQRKTALLKTLSPKPKTRRALNKETNLHRNPRPKSKDAAKNTLREAPSGDRENPVARSQQDPGFDEQRLRRHDEGKAQRSLRFRFSLP